jgi:membrane-associated phospholipid phosphatase
MFYPHLVGPDQSYAMLHDRVSELGRLAALEGDKLATPIGHVALLNRYIQGNFVPGFGISAMPSVHVAMATLFAIGGFVVHRWLGWVMAAYAVLIWIGSVYLGWHYATDGIVGATMTIGLWKLSGKLAESFEDRVSPA